MKQWIVILCLLAGCRTAPVPQDVPAEVAVNVPTPSEVMAEVAKLDSGALWPRFDVRAFPVAMFDGKQTWLFGYPEPPEEFRKVTDDVYVYDGRHPAVTANSTALIDNMLTATLLRMPDSLTMRERVGMVVHELFHAFLTKRQPKWLANEAELFVYPTEDVQNIALARLETEALRRALQEEGETSVCWAAAAMDVRRQRFTKLSPSAASYEWGTELSEGLPTYVQHRAAETPDERVRPPSFDAGAVRQRAYGTGHAMARLLDRFSPNWRKEIGARDIRPLDLFLTVAVVDALGKCAFTDAERAEAQKLAEQDVAAMRTGRERRRTEFLAQRGWRLVVTMKEGVLWPQGFDPLNVHVVAPGEVLHTRHVKLGNEQSAIEILDRTALSVAAGAHPLFNGVKSVAVGGLAEKPVVEEKDGIVTIRAAGVEGRLRAADVDVIVAQPGDTAPEP